MLTNDTCLAVPTLPCYVKIVLQSHKTMLRRSKHTLQKMNSDCHYMVVRTVVTVTTFCHSSHYRVVTVTIYFLQCSKLMSTLSHTIQVYSYACLLRWALTYVMTGHL